MKCRPGQKRQGFIFVFLFLGSLNLYSFLDPMGRDITIASEPDYPPYCFMDEEGNAAGFSVELFQAAAGAMGIHTDIRVDVWNNIKNDLAEGRLDALPLVGRTPEREEFFDFTIPYLSLYGGIVVRESTEEIHTLDDLEGLVVAVMRGDNAEEFLRRVERPFEIVTTDTFVDALNLLSRGTCDAVVIQRLVAFRLIREEGFRNLKVLADPIPDFRQDFCFAVQEGNKDLLALLNEGLALVMADGTFRRLQTTWFASYDSPSRKIVVGGDRNYPPFEYLDKKGQPAGYTVDLTRAIAREMNLEIEFYLGPWSKVLAMFERGEIDVLQGMLFSTRRNKYFDFSQAHTVNHGVAVVRGGEGKAPPGSLDELRDLTILVQEDDIMHDFALENGLEERLVVAETQEEALRMLYSGAYDCSLVSRLTALYLINKNNWNTLQIGKSPLLSSEYCYAVKKNRGSLLSNFNQGLAVIEETGEYRSIYNKWLGVYDLLPPSFEQISRYILIILLPLLVILGLFVLWTRSLRRQVERRTAELREREEFQKAIIACSPVALYSIDPDGTVRLWNESAERIFGWKADEVIGRPLPIVPSFKQEEFESLRRSVLDGGDYSGRELVRKKKDGSLFPVTLSAAPIRNEKNSIIGILGAAEDISERKKAEEELRKYREHLEGLVEEKTRELQERVTELEHFHDATIDRELRMKELRDEIKRLKGGPS